MHTVATDPISLPAHELGEAIAARKLSPVDVVGTFLDRIAAQERKLHAFIAVYADEAQLAAEAADKAIRSGHAVGPLHGVPIALKDLIEIEGKIATGGAFIWRERRAERTATLARRLIAQGMIVLGKTHTVEFAYGGGGTNHRLGTPWEPWGPKAAPIPPGASRGARGAAAARRARRRLGAPARLVLRADRAENHDRAREHLRHPAAQPDARHSRPDGALGRGCRAALSRDVRARSARSAHARRAAGRSRRELAG